MNRRIVLLSVVLLALAGWFGWMLRQRWLEQRAHERSVLAQAAHPRLLPAPAPAPAVAPASPGDYLDVAQKTLFSQDRNPNVIVDPPKPPPPPPPMPALPAYWGQMNFGTPVVLLTLPKSSDQKSYSVGEKVGDFVLTAFDRDSITFDWNGTAVQRKLTELAPKAGDQPPQQQAQVAAPPPSPSVSIVTPRTQNPNQPPEVGIDSGNEGRHACVMGDNSPAGTVSGGFRKVTAQGLFGAICYWEPVK